MGLHIAAGKMTSDATPHTATAIPIPVEPVLWTVTWLPGRNLTRDQAVSAMMLAEMCADVADLIKPGSVRWVHVEGWAGELGLEPETAVLFASMPPQDTA